MSFTESSALENSLLITAELRLLITCIVITYFCSTGYTHAIYFYNHISSAAEGSSLVLETIITCTTCATDLAVAPIMSKS